jgi:hypothetical protein
MAVHKERNVLFLSELKTKATLLAASQFPFERLTGFKRDAFLRVLCRRLLWSSGLRVAT